MSDARGHGGPVIGGTTAGTRIFPHPTAREGEAATGKRLVRAFWAPADRPGVVSRWIRKVLSPSGASGRARFAIIARLPSRSARDSPRVPILPPTQVPALRLTQIKLAGFKSFVDPTTIATPGQLVGHRRPERLRQVQRHRRRPLGARRIEGVGAARRVDAGRDLQRRRRSQAGRSGVGRAPLRQQRRPHRRPVGQVHRHLDQARADARRRLDLLHQQHPGPPPRHPRPVPRHGPRPARLRDHRAGDDLAGRRGEARGAADLPRGGGGRVEVQGAAQGDRRPALGRAREPRARRGHPHRARRAARRSSSTRRASRPSTASTRRASSRRSTCCGSPSSRTPCARASAARPRSRR